MLHLINFSPSQATNSMKKLFLNFSFPVSRQIVQNKNVAARVRQPATTSDQQAEKNHSKKESSETFHHLVTSQHQSIFFDLNANFMLLLFLCATRLCLSFSLSSQKPFQRHKNSHQITNTIEVKEIISILLSSSITHTLHCTLE